MKEIIRELYQKSFSRDRLHKFLSLFSSDQEIINQQVEINGQYSSAVSNVAHFLTARDVQGNKLPVYIIKLQSNGELIDLDQEFAACHFPQEHQYLLTAVCQLGTENWYLSLRQQDLPVERSCFFVCNSEINAWESKRWEDLSRKRKLVWSDLETVFNPRQLREDFLADCEELIAQGMEETNQESPGELVLQVAVLFFIQQLSCLRENLLLTLYRSISASKNYWRDYLQPLLTKLADQGQKKVNYKGYQLISLGKTVDLLTSGGHLTIPNEWLKKILTTFNHYSFSLRENTPWQQQVSLTPRVLSDLFARLVKEEQRRKRGVVYTPPVIVNYLAQEGIINYLLSVVEQLNKQEITEFVYYGQISSQLMTKAEELETELADFKICDPAGGSGAFTVGMQQELVRLRRKLARAVGRDTSLAQLAWDTLKNSLYSVEINPQAVKIARLRLWLNTIGAAENYSQINHISGINYNIVEGNSLLTKENSLFDSELQAIKKLQKKYYQAKKIGKRYQLQEQIDNLLASLPEDSFSFAYYFPLVFADNGGFDLVIGNPPYVGEKGNKDLFRRIKDYPLGRFYQGRMDLFYFFFHLGLDLVVSGGHLVYITTNYFLRATGAYELRTDLKQRATVKKLINFNELKLFPAAIGQHNLISVVQKGSKKLAAETVVTKRKGTADRRAIFSLLYGIDKQTKRYQIPHSLLYEGQENYLQLEQGTAAEILARVKKQGVELGSLCSINQGIVTGCDRISGRHTNRYDLEVERGKGVFVVDKEVAAEFELEDSSIIKPWFKNSHIDTWLPEEEAVKERLLYLDHDQEKLPEELKKHLMPFKEILAARREAKQNRIKWWQLQWPRGEKLFEGPKLIAPQRHRYNVFAYTEVPWYASADVYYIKPRDSRCSLKYLLALLNSDLYYLWLYKKGKKKGDILELYQRPLSEVPIKLVSFDQQQPFIELVDQVIADKRNLRQLQAISWSDKLPAKAVNFHSLQKLARDYQIIYSGQAQKVRKIKVEVTGRSAVIYSARGSAGWYKTVQVQLQNKMMSLYLKYYLENLTNQKRKEVNASNQGLVNRILNIELPIYGSEIRSKLVTNWCNLKSKRNRLNQTIKQQEEQINELVYDLYGLDKQEKKKIKTELGTITFNEK